MMKLEHGRLERLVKLVGEYLSLLEIVETTDDGREFRPNQLGSCRVMDGSRMNEILNELRQIVDQSNAAHQPPQELEKGNL
jgi:hypothetical protein